MTPQSMSFAASDDGDELARAEVYGVLAHLFVAAPGEALYEQLRVAPTEAPAAGGFLEEPWRGLVGAARRLTRQQVVDEYDALFQGLGKPEIFLYGSYHLAGAVNDKPLVELRRDLQGLGLERAEGVIETEDHLASLCEVMRFLIAGDDASICNLTQQRRFFRVHLQPWVEGLAGEIEGHPRADFYAAVAGFLRAFAQVEAQGFDLIE